MISGRVIRFVVIAVLAVYRLESCLHTLHEMSRLPDTNATEIR